MIGKTISHYRVVKELGRGGMGAVYLAEHTRLKQPVALKFLPREFTGDEAAKTRFVHEAQAASSLKHHRVCTIHDIDETDDGQLFICMDLYEGGSLQQQLEKGPMAIGDALDLAAQIADGLSAAHESEIVHRDIKPANILLTKTGEAKIADFGLAKLAGRTRVTKTGTTVGTAAYMSPEQTQGHDVETPSDVWSLGVVLYEMLTGKLPFEGDHNVALAYGIVNTDPVPLAVHRSDIPDALQEIIDRCLAKNPEDRYPSATELRDALEAVRGERSDGTVTGQQRSGARGGRRTKGLPLIAIAAVIIAVAAFAVYKFYPRPAAAEQAIAVVDFQDISGEDDPTRSAGITSLVNVGLIENSPIRVVSTSYLHELKRRLFNDTEGTITMDQAIEVARESGASLALVGEVSVAGDDQLVMWQLVETKNGRAVGAKTVRGADMLVCADAVVTGVLPLFGNNASGTPQQVRTPVQDVSTDSPEAYKHYVASLLYFDRSLTADARRELERAIEIDSTFALAYLQLSKAHYGPNAGVTHNLELARHCANGAWRHRERLDAKERLRLEARRHWIDSRNPEAYAIYEEILERWPDDREVLEDYASDMYYRWNFEKAATLAERGIELYPQSEQLATLCVAAFGSMNQNDRALEAARRSTTRFAENPNWWDTLGETYVRVGQPDSAAAAFENALAADPDFLYSLEGLARISYSQGDIQGAIDRTRALLARGDLTEHDRFRLMVGYHAMGLAMYHAERGECQKALDLVEESWPLGAHNTGVKKHLGYARSRFLMRMGRYEDALEFATAFQDSLIDGTGIWEFEWFRARSQIALGDLDTPARTTRLMRESGRGQKIVVFAVGMTAELELAEGRAAEAIDTFLEFKRMGGWGAIWDEIEGRKNLARAYHMAGRSDEAIAELTELLRIYGGHALAHYELGKIYEDMGRTSDASREYTTFLDMWSAADTDMPQLIDARGRLAGLPRS